MKIELALDQLVEMEADVLVVPIFKGEALDSSLLNQLNELSRGVLTSLMEAGEFAGKKFDIAYGYIGGNAKISRLLLIGAGEPATYTSHLLARLAGAAVRFLIKKRLGKVVFLARPAQNSSMPSTVQTIAEAALIAPYEQTKYQKKEAESDFQLDTFKIASIDQTIAPADFEAALTKANILAEAINFTRDLVLEPGNKLPPQEFARRAQTEAGTIGLECQILDEKALQEMGMGAILAVSQGSEEPSQLIVLRYKGSKTPNSQPIALVGKGITFDSGGICIKPRDDMWEMKTDMSGGATVIGTLCAIAKLKPEIDVIGIVAASENLPSGSAYKPGDVLKAYSGKMIEVIDTDAEGRLVLADALHYATQQNPSCIIDLATLTGACIIALGNLRAGMMGSNSQLLAEVQAASERAGEKLWPLPLDKEYSDMIKSDIADIKNLGGRFAGAITAAAFLREFVGDVPWVHLDIAGTAWLEESQPDMAKGPSGYGIRTLVDLILNRAVAN